MPFITQARLLMAEDELRGTARVLRQTIPDLVKFDQTSVPFLRESRALSACTNNVLVPFMGLKIPNPETGNEAENSDQPVRAQLQRGMPGLSGESRLSDGNNQYFHAGATPPGDRVRPGLAAGRRQHAAAAPAGHARARRRSCRTCTRPAARSRRSRSSTPAPGQVVEPPAPVPNPTDMLTGMQDYVDNILPLVAKEKANVPAPRAAAGEGERPMMTAIKKNLADFLAIVGVVVLGLGDRRVRPLQPAPALPARGEAVLHGEGRAARRAGGHARPGPDRASRRACGSATSARSTSRTARPS